jgi:hypothetical protein
MRLALVLSLVVVSAYSASASIDVATTGPYNVSFNMNTSLKYIIQPNSSIVESFRTSYPMLIKSNNTAFALIKIIEYNNLTDSTPDLWSTIDLRGLEKIGLKNITYQPNMSIDNHSAFGFTGLDFQERRMYFASYWLDSKPCECGPVFIGKTNIIVESSYPLNMTAELLGSMHVEKNLPEINQKTNTMSFAPPKSDKK